MTCIITEVWNDEELRTFKKYLSKHPLQDVSEEQRIQQLVDGACLGYTSSKAVLIRTVEDLVVHKIIEESGPHEIRQKVVKSMETEAVTVSALLYVLFC